MWEKSFSNCGISYPPTSRATPHTPAGGLDTLCSNSKGLPTTAWTAPTTRLPLVNTRGTMAASTHGVPGIKAERVSEHRALHHQCNDLGVTTTKVTCPRCQEGTILCMWRLWEVRVRWCHHSSRVYLLLWSWRGGPLQHLQGREEGLGVVPLLRRAVTVGRNTKEFTLLPLGKGLGSGNGIPPSLDSYRGTDIERSSLWHHRGQERAFWKGHC